MNQITNDDDELIECSVCEKYFLKKRWFLGYDVCLQCGEEAAIAIRNTWTIAPLHKSNYLLVTNKEDLIGVNNKGGLVK